MSRHRYSAILGDSLAEAFDDLRGDYTAAKNSRFRRRRTGVPPAGSSADYHYRSEADYLRILETSRDIDRNDCVVGQGIDRLCDNVVQDGMQLNVDTGDKGLDAELANRWYDDSKDPARSHASGELTRPELERMGLRASIVDGDIVLLPLEDGTLQPVEAHRIRTPTGTKRNVVNGFLLDERTRKRLECWISRDDIDPSRPLKLVSEITRYEVWAADEFGPYRQLLHHYLPKRLSQTRGVSALAPIMDMIGIHDDLQFAKLVQAQVVSCFAFLRTPGPGQSIGPVPPTGPGTNVQVSADFNRRVEGVAPGMELLARNGEKIEGFSPNVPNAEFRPHALLVLTFIAINLNLPLAVLLLDPSNTNFSGWRGAIDQARQTFRRLQRSIINRIDEPYYQIKVRQWAADDPAILRVASAKSGKIKLFAHEFNGPRWPYIEPYTDAQADVLRRSAVLSSPRRIAAERGEDWEDITTETIADNAAAIVAAKARAAQINQEFPDDGQPVHWRELLSLPMPQGITMNFGSQPEQDRPPERGGSQE